jgi:hypothetical protein
MGRQANSCGVTIARLHQSARGGVVLKITI